MGLSGAYAMAIQRYRIASLIWLVSNALLVLLTLFKQMHMLTAMYMVYGALSGYSLINISKANRKALEKNALEE